jgi:hypothetical protein
MIYLKYFENHEGYSDAVNEEQLEYPNVSVCKTQKHVHYSKVPPIKWVDLGLPSGTLWANVNLGAKSETDHGLVYQWGGDQAYTVEELLNNPLASSLPYKYYDEATSAYTKYNATDQKATLDAMDDMAFIKATDATHWAMTPYPEAFDELYSGTTQAEVTINGVPCVQFTSKINSNSILFPKVRDPEHPTTPGFVDCWTGLLTSPDDYSLAIAYDLTASVSIDEPRRFAKFIRPIAIIMAPNLSETLSGKEFTGETITMTSFTENELNYVHYSCYKLGINGPMPSKMNLNSDDGGKYINGESRWYSWTFRLNALYEITGIDLIEHHLD